MPMSKDFQERLFPIVPQLVTHFGTPFHIYDEVGIRATGEALKTAFEEELNDSSLIWRVINYDEKENEHYLKDYSLYTKALILSRVKDGSELEWKNLSKIWELVGNKDEFLKYVQDETRDFINKESD